MSREAMQIALDALEANLGNWAAKTKAVKVLRQALETEQEPVAWISDSPTKGNGKQLHWTKSEAWRWSSNITPLYTAPPKREWVGLTDKDIHDAFNFTEMVKQLSWDREPERWCKNFAAYIEAKLKEKNT